MCNFGNLIKTLIVTFIFAIGLACIIGSSGGGGGGGDDVGGGSGNGSDYCASGIWEFTFTQTGKVDGDYIECGTESVPNRSFTVIQNGNDVSLLDKNGEVVEGSVSGNSYVFDFIELEDISEEDYFDFHIELKLSSDTSGSGTYRMDERTFFTEYDETFFCITEGTLVGTKIEDHCVYTDTVKDIDGNIYQTIKIGDQWWMMENLKVTHYRTGDIIAQTIDDTEWSNHNSGGYCSYNNDDSNIDTYGLLYNWYAVDDSRGLAPEGWHIPTQSEWQQLIDHLGGYLVAGGKLKEAGTTHWDDPNTGGTNESGFTGLPSGERYPNGTFEDIGHITRFYSSTEGADNRAVGRYLFSTGSAIQKLIFPWNYGLSIRCVKD